MRLCEIAQPKGIASKIAGTQVPMIVYHGSDQKIEKFRRPPSGVFFSPHIDMVYHYGETVTTAYLWIPKLYIVDHNDEYGEQVLDSLFDRDYATLATQIQELQKAGYYALQTKTDSEMICVFSNAKIYSAETGEEM
jgi:hypothetical protein